MDCKLYVGQRVVCIDAVPDDPKKPKSVEPLVEGTVYTIRWIRPTRSVVAESNALVGLMGIQKGQNKFGDEAGYRHTRFKPTTDISSLEALLKQKPQPARKREDA
jgi:hypothetical protein